jgi:hypothetical protein
MDGVCRELLQQLQQLRQLRQPLQSALDLGVVGIVHLFVKLARSYTF